MNAPRTVKHPWGYEKFLHEDAEYTMKEVHLNYGGNANKRVPQARIILVLMGKMNVEFDGRQVKVGPGEVLKVTSKKEYRLRSLTTFTRFVEVFGGAEDHSVAVH